MALVTVERTPEVASPSSGPDDDPAAGDMLDNVARQVEEDSPRKGSLSECYFAVKGAALVLPQHGGLRMCRKNSTANSADIQRHLQAMFYILRADDTLKMAVKLESVHPARTRYLVVVSCLGRQSTEESCLLGIDCNERTTIGLVLRVLAHTAITLDGDGGFSVKSCERQHIFKPVSVQAMWSALQTLHKASSKAREYNYFMGGLTHEWVEYYEQHISSDQSCLNEWNAMDNLESRRPPSPDSVRSKPTVRDVTEQVIRSKLKEIMMSVDLDEVTSKYIRTRLEEDLDMDLAEYKSFIDQEMLVILGQMDAATEIFEHVYLGSEWNASNMEELQRNGVSHILNVTREIDNFFPGIFNYLNIRVYDDEKTELLKHWDDTYRYIHKAKSNGSKVLVHCKMGVSRSASVVIAYAMKAYNWELQQALDHVKRKRSCIKPNSSFMRQLEIYQGMLLAMKNRDKLQRSKSETNLKSPGLVNKADKEKPAKPNKDQTGGGGQEKMQPTFGLYLTPGFAGGRPKSWSPDDKTAAMLFPENTSSQTSLSAEHINMDVTDSVRNVGGVTTEAVPEKLNINLHLRMPCSNGQTYSVTQNQVLNISCPSDSGSLDGGDSPVVYECVNTALVEAVSTEEEVGVASVRDRVSELESQKASAPSGKRLQRDSLPERKGLVLNLATQFENGSKPGSPVEDSGSGGEDIVEVELELADEEEELRVMSRAKSGQKWDSEKENTVKDLFSAQVDRVFDREERRQVPPAPHRESPSRQSSWGSYDSAVVLSVAGEEAPSRQSSWGSGDAPRWQHHPSRNSSWGSYDMRPMQYVAERGECDGFTYDREAIPWTPGTVRRTKQMLEKSGGARSGSSSEGESPAKTTAPSRRHYASSPVLCSRRPDDCPPMQKLASSAPAIHSHEFQMRRADVFVPAHAVSIHDLPLTDITIATLNPGGPVDETPAHPTCQQKEAVEAAGVVRTLREEFEAKSGAVTKVVEPSPIIPELVIPDPEPVPKPTPESPKASPNPLEDISVRNLVDRFEVVEEPRRRAASDAASPPSPPPAPSVPPRKSSLDLGPARRTLYSRPQENNNNNNNQHHRNRHCPRLERNNSTNQRSGMSGVGGLCGGSSGSSGRPPTAVKPASPAPVPSHLPPPVPSHLPPPAPAPTAAPSGSILPTKVRKQQGKTHPLDKLVLKQPPARHPNPVYNTM